MINRFWQWVRQRLGLTQRDAEIEQAISVINAVLQSHQQLAQFVQTEILPIVRECVGSNNDIETRLARYEEQVEVIRRVREIHRAQVRKEQLALAKAQEARAEELKLQQAREAEAITQAAAAASNGDITPQTAVIDEVDIDAAVRALHRIMREDEPLGGDDAEPRD